MNTRREFLQKVMLAGTAGLVSVRPPQVAAEQPPETTKLRLVNLPAACLAPQYVAEDLLRDEGFERVEYVKMAKDDIYQFLGSGEADFSMSDSPSWVIGIDAGAPIVVLSGIHPGCYDLFAQKEIRSIRDLRGS